jgi:hypothetical protein
MIPNVDEQMLTTEFDFEGNKPEAPWIKRCDYGIKFTDEIQLNDLVLTKDESPQPPKDKNKIPISLSEEILKNSINLFAESQTQLDEAEMMLEGFDESCERKEPRHSQIEQDSLR